MKGADHEIALNALNQNEYAIRIPLCESHLPFLRQRAHTKNKSYIAAVHSQLRYASYHGEMASNSMQWGNFFTCEIGSNGMQRQDVLQQSTQA